MKDWKGQGVQDPGCTLQSLKSGEVALWTRAPSSSGAPRPETAGVRTEEVFAAAGDGPQPKFVERGRLH